MQRVEEIEAPMEYADKTADAIRPMLEAGWRVVHMAEVRALSPVNLQPITSSIVVIFERSDP